MSCISLYCSSLGHFFFFAISELFKVDEDTINNKINSTYGENNCQNNENFNEENNNNLYEEEEPREDIIKEQMNDNINNYSIKKLKNSSINQKPKEIDTKINILKHKKLGNKVNKICI